MEQKSIKSIKTWRKEHKAKELCADCTKKAVVGHLRCQDHLDYQAEQARVRRGQAKQ